MANKTPKKKSVSKKKFSLDDFKAQKGLNNEVKDKDLTWLPLSEAFSDALNIPGIPRGYVSLFRGFSNTGKSTAIYETIRACQQSDTKDIPVIIDTEGNFDWEHAKNIGVEFEEVVDEKTGEVIDYKGDFLFIDGDGLLERYGNFNYKEGKESSKILRSEPVIEDVQHYISEMLDEQERGNLPFNLCFLWDSIGSTDCYESVMSNTPNNMWNAGALERSFKSILNHRIPASRKQNKEFTNTIAAVQKVWLDSVSSPRPTIKHKGGEGFYYGSRLIVHFGGILSHGTQLLNATAKGQKYQFGVKTKVRSAKNQVNGVETEGEICSTPHGFINPDKINDYKNDYREHILQQMNLSANSVDDINIEAEEKSLSNEDITQ